MIEQPTTIACQYCGQQVGEKRYESHIRDRCPKSPQAGSRISKRRKKKARLEKTKQEEVRRNTTPEKLINVRSRLDRLYKDIRNNSSRLDDRELAKTFVAFYEYYVSDRKHRTSEGGGNSVRVVSGGLPSLGKRAK